MSEQVWCKDEKDAWVPATVIERDDNVVVCKKSNSEEVTIPLTGKHAEVVEDVDQEGAKKDVENLVDLESFTEGMVLHHIKKRYEANKIYTFVGSILVAVNPFQGLPIYSKGHIDDIRAKTAANEAASPHVFTTAGTAYHFLEDTNLPQSVLISGESGAGKTETAKKVLEFIAEVAKGKSAGPDDVSIQDQILRSNPVLESFGNAKVRGTVIGE
jgi:myosin heavy subunit